MVHTVPFFPRKLAGLDTIVAVRHYLLIFITASAHNYFTL